MSEPMVFWREIECSGVSNLGGRQSWDSIEDANTYRLHWGPVVRT